MLGETLLMNRTPMLVGVLAFVVLALLIVACGSDPTPTTAPAATTAPTVPPPATVSPQPTSPPATATPAPTQAPTRAAPLPTVAPTPAPTPEEPEEIDPSDAYFAMERVLEVSIEIDPEDWDTLRHQTRTFEDLMAEIEKYQLSRPFASIYDWFSATVTIDGETHTEVGVRKKGFLGSQSDTKPSLKLRYDKYVDGQSLGGVMERMTLNNSVQDPSMVNTCLAYQVFAAAGNPAPRCNFATVTVNGKELGLYVHLEELKKPFLARHFDSAEGNLYEGTISDFTPEYRGTMEKKTNEDEDDWSDLDAVMSALLDPSDAGLEALGELVDLDRFLSFWATESLVGHWDGYAGDRNNYHFYREPDGKFVFLPWGVDDTFHLKDDPNPFDNISEPPPSVLALSAIPNRLYNIPEWRAKYAERLKDILETVWDEDELLASVDAMAAIVQQHALPDARATAAEDTERVRKFILKRKGEILADITPEPPDWPEPEYGAATADGVESFELRFETTWGSSQGANPLAEGTVYELTEDGEWVVATEGDAGATAGPASAQEAADIGVENAALFTVMGLYPDGAIRGVTFWMPVDRVAAGAKLSIGVDADVGGVVWTIPAGRFEPEGFIPVAGGGIELAEAGTEPGAVIAGHLYAYFGDGQIPDGEGATGRPVSGSVEVSFETAWGSDKSANPFGEGSVTNIARDGGSQSPEGLGVIAGIAGPDEQLLLPDVQDLASIAVLGIEEDGSLQGLTIVLPISRLADGATLIIGEDPVAGGVWGIPPGGISPDFFLPFTEGTLTLSQTGTEPGAAIVGDFSGEFIGTFSTEKVTAIVAVELDESRLILNEVAAKGDPLDWFELYNIGDSVIDLTGYVVADDLTNAAKRVAFPPGAAIAPGEYLQVELDKNGWPGFALSSDEELGIWTADGELITKIDWEEGYSGAGQSIARVPDITGGFQTVGNPTPGAANQP
ncbi:MAG: hypothetical protein F4X66_11995 [Chloroflexi bacterium]|nr:hypothetical protein [Chloroflexota bacterium]MYE38897.1 hypothetical protein [Chloroflexota bacterium]